MVRIRVMTGADIEAVSTIRVRGWQTAYAGIVPQGCLDKLSVTRDAAERRKFFARSAGRVHNLVAESPEGELVGWASLGPYRSQEFPAGVGELYALYAHPDRVGTGVGRALITAALDRGTELGWDRVLLWVLAENARARRFYSHAGFAPDGAETVDDYEGAQLRELRYARDL
jgi:GNAT superfamily N-acetyltransferase